MRNIFSLLALAVLAFGQGAPSITNVTNAAIPSLDYPPESISLAPPEHGNDIRQQHGGFYGVLNFALALQCRRHRSSSG
jgi:hypothetical protein